jgi:hypothetical protein
VQVSTNSLIILPRYGLEMNRQEAKQRQNAIDQNKIQQFMNKAVGDIAGSSTAMLVIIGERLGL